MKTKRNKQIVQRRTALAAKDNRAKPFTEHLLELRRRTFYVLVSIASGAAAAYFVQQHIVAVLLKPAGDQQFIYTSPGGGLNFLIQICVYTGLILSIPAIVYNLLKFIEPVLPRGSANYILRSSAVAGLLAMAGVGFGYLFALPSALKFLSHQFMTDQVRAMIAVQSYLSFVTMFLLGSALIFQAPLVMLFINRIKPLRPQKLFKAERWVILVSFILGAVISPSPDIKSMLVLSIPMIITYQIGIALVWHANRHSRKPKKVLALLEQDALAQAERLKNVEAILAHALVPQQLAMATAPAETPQVRSYQESAQPMQQTSAVHQSEPVQTKVASAKSTTSISRSNYQDIMTSQRIRRRII